jgi:hypothetical protein
VTAAWGGVLAGLGFGFALAFLMHVIAQASPEAGAFNIAGSIFGVVTLGGLLLGIGLGMVFAAVIPDGPGDTPVTDRATVTDQPASELPGPGT